MARRRGARSSQGGRASRRTATRPGRRQQAAGAAAQEKAGRQVDGDASGGTDYEATLKARDARIAELSAKVAEAAKTAEATKALNEQIEALKAQMADERVEFALRSAGARSVRAAKALLSEHDGMSRPSWRPSRGCSGPTCRTTCRHTNPPQVARPVWSPRASQAGATGAT